MEIAQTCIYRGFFPDGSDVRQILDAIMMEARWTLMYRRQRWRQKTEGLMDEEPDEA